MSGKVLRSIRLDPADDAWLTANVPARERSRFIQLAVREQIERCEAERAVEGAVSKRQPHLKTIVRAALRIGIDDGA